MARQAGEIWGSDTVSGAWAPQQHPEYRAWPDNLEELDVLQVGTCDDPDRPRGLLASCPF